jgi:hypothetical protein
MMKRREFFTKAGISSAALVSVPAFATLEPGPPAWNDGGEQSGRERDRGHKGDHVDLTDPLASATVIFGQWNADPALDRFPSYSPRAANHHQLIPGHVRIKAGGAVTFIISGFHHVLVYGHGTKPTDISLTNTIFPFVQLGPALGPPLINDPVNRVYRGLDPSVFPILPGSSPSQPLQDRVEVVRFPNPGRYLVLCGVLPHFYDAVSGEFIMFGYVSVFR